MKSPFFIGCYVVQLVATFLLLHAFTTYAPIAHVIATEQHLSFWGAIGIWICTFYVIFRRRRTLDPRQLITLVLPAVVVGILAAILLSKVSR